jgi:hypothetical protein
MSDEPDVRIDEYGLHHIRQLRGETHDLFLLRVFTILLPKLSEHELIAYLGYINARSADEWVKRRKAIVDLLTRPPKAES